MIKNPFQIIRDATPPVDIARGAVIALGNFDGVHLGHRTVIAAAQKMAKNTGQKAFALSFEPHPRSFFNPAAAHFPLTNERAKLRLLAGTGLDGAVVLDFNAARAATSAQDFINQELVERLGVTGISVGDDFHFGKGRTGSPEMLQAHGLAAGIPVAVVPPFSWKGEPVSSTLIRTALEAGDVARAAEFLGRPWLVRGLIAHGDKRGRELGYPTANMQLARDCRLRHGIYAVRMKIDGIWHDGVASFGRRPTFDDGAPRLETFVFDFSGDLYGQRVDVAFVDWLRGEEKFDTLEALIAQMDADSARARDILAKTPAFLP